MPNIVPSPPSKEVRYKCPTCGHDESDLLNTVARIVDWLRNRPNIGNLCPECGKPMQPYTQDSRFPWPMP